MNHKGRQLRPWLHSSVAAVAEFPEYSLVDESAWRCRY